MAKYGDPVFGTVEEKYPLVHTANGKIIGENRDKIAIFHGIPYGGRCDRERRFLPPEPMKPWEGVYDCTRNGNISIQLGESIAESEAFGFYWSGGGHPENFGVQYEKRSENCLYLNVLTPGLDGKKRPVMVYFTAAAIRPIPVRKHWEPTGSCGSRTLSWFRSITDWT